MLGGDGNFSVRLRSCSHGFQLPAFSFTSAAIPARTRHAASRIIDANLYAKHLVHAFLAGLHISRQEFSLLIDLFQDSLKNRIRKRVDSNFGFLPELEAAIFGFGDVDANVDLILFEERRDGSIRCDKVARAHIENFDDGSRRSDDLAFPEAGFVVSVGCFRQVDVFPTVAAFKFFQVGLRLMVVRFSGGNFLGTVATLEFSELMLGALLLGDGDFPVSFRGITLLFGNKILFCQCFIAVEIQVRADFVGFRTIEIGLRSGDVFLTIAVPF